MTQAGYAALKPEGGIVNYDGESTAEPDTSYWVEMSIDPNEVYLPDISTIKQAIDSHIDNIVFDKDEYIYNLIHKLVGDYISEDMIMRLST